MLQKTLSKVQTKTRDKARLKEKLYTIFFAETPDTMWVGLGTYSIYVFLLLFYLLCNSQKNGGNINR